MSKMKTLTLSQKQEKETNLAHVSNMENKFETHLNVLAVSIGVCGGGEGGTHKVWKITSYKNVEIHMLIKREYNLVSNPHILIVLQIARGHKNISLFL